MNNWIKSFYKVTGYPEDPNEIRFDVYEYYLENWVSFIKQKYNEFDDFVKFVVNKTKRIQGKKDIDSRYLKRFLYIGWNTEFLLSYNDTNFDTEILRISNQWKPIQAYYSVYSLAEAAIYCLDSKAESHSSCLKRISEYLVRKSNIKDIKPWGLAFEGYKGNKRVSRTISPINFPPGLSIPNALKRKNVSPLESIACCLRAEHRNRIDEWERPKGAVYKYKYDPGLTTFLHFLYRLRIKSNYKDVELFMVNAPDNKIKSFSDNLSFLVKFTNGLLEMLIIRRYGKKGFIKLAGNFLEKNEDAHIKERVKYYQNYI